MYNESGGMVSSETTFLGPALNMRRSRAVRGTSGCYSSPSAPRRARLSGRNFWSRGDLVKSCVLLNGKHRSEVFQLFREQESRFFKAYVPRKIDIPN